MQGFNMGRYIPPDLEGTTSGNKIHRHKAPGTLRKDGSQTVRFELPYAVWCHSCQPHAILGQGVRFNAEKKKVGYYYSTPIWSFGLKHAACGGRIEIRTDPKNTAYVVVEGGKARDYGEDKVREGEGGVEILTEAERERRREDAFAALEGKAEEKEVVKDNAKRINELYETRERDWEDPFTANKRIRATFRQERKARKREEEADEALRDRLGTDMDLLPEREEDAKRAKLVSYGVKDRGDGAAASRRMFDGRTPQRSKVSSVKSAKESRADTLRKQLIGNTRAAMNPFGGLQK